MKNSLNTVLLILGIGAANVAYGQRDSRDNDAYRNDDRRSSQQTDRATERRLIDAYKKGYEDGMEDAEQKVQKNGRASGNYSMNSRQPDRNKKVETKRPYKAFTGGFYAGANSTRFRGEDVNGDDLTGRLGYQVGVFARGGGRIYGQIGAEYFASTSDFFRPGDGQGLDDISERIDTKWVQIPAYIGVKLAQSKRGISGVRLAVGAEYANRINSDSDASVDNAELKSGTFLALANLGFDIGPLLIDFVYHHGLDDAVKGYQNSQRRSVGINVGFKF